MAKIPDGWRVMGGFEIVQAGDKLFNWKTGSAVDCHASTGKTVSQAISGPDGDECSFIRRVQCGEPKLVWRKEPPDTVGLWMTRDAGCNDESDLYRQCYLISEKRLENKWRDGLEFCRIGDLPAISEPVQYRDVTPADLVDGPIECEVSNDPSLGWKRCYVIGFRYASRGIDFYARPNPEMGCPFSAYSYARIPVTEPTKQPREWWLGCHPDGVSICAYQDPKAVKADRWSIHVREVLP